MRLASLVGWLACAVAALPAQEVSLAHAPDGQAVATLHAFCANGADHSGGLGFVRIDVQNVDGQAHVCDVELATMRWDSMDVKVGQRLQLGPQERGRVFLPLPTPMASTTLRLIVDGTSVATRLNLTRHDAAVALAALSRPDLEPQALTAVRAVPSGFPDPTRLLPCQVDDLPSDWRLYSGFHCVLVDGRAAVGEGVQEALRRYAFAGGTVLVADGQRLTAGSLRSLAAGAPVANIAHGLGQVVFLGAFGGDTGDLHRLVDRLPPAGQGPLPVGPVLQEPQSVPNLGEARVTVFLTIILVFAIAVGPVNFLWLRRRRRPLLALITVPVLGFGTTAVILAFGMFHDGFGVRGTVTSWTFVDQPRHEGVTVAARTLFAGLAPSGLTMGADAIVLAPRVTTGRQGIDRWHFDPMAQRLDGGALPSRLPTPLVGVQQGLLRQRLVVRFAGDSAQLLGDGGLQPVGTVLLRDLEGTLWGGSAPTLHRVAEAAGAASLEALQRDGGAVQIAADAVPSPRWRRSRAEEDGMPSGARDVGTLAARMFAPLARGEFVTRVELAPWLDEHGLEVAYDRQVHCVRGRLAAEDCLR